MKREIKFRVYDSISKVMHQWDAIYHLSLIDFLPDHYTLMQFTGLKDKNGVEIYEGDICNFHVFTQELGEGLGVYEGEKETIVEISIGELGIWLQGDSEENSGYALWFDGIHEESFEVIGNVHENKELLK